MSDKHAIIILEPGISDNSLEEQLLSATACAQQLQATTVLCLELCISDPSTSNQSTNDQNGRIELGRSVFESLNFNQVSWLKLSASHFYDINSIIDALTDHLNPCSYLLGCSGEICRDLIPAIAITLNLTSLANVTQIGDDQSITLRQCAGNLSRTITLNDTDFAANIIHPFFHPNDTLEATKPTAVIELDDIQIAEPANIRLTATPTLANQIDLSSSDLVLSGGRGLGSAEAYQTLIELSQQLNAAAGASRAVVDAQWTGNERQVGQTGIQCAANLYIALGISGAIQHLAGITDCQTVLAVNTDADASIFESADYGLVMDAQEFIDRLQVSLTK